MANPKVEWSVQGKYDRSNKWFWCSLNGKSEISGLRQERTTDKEFAKRVQAEIQGLYPACTYRLVKRRREGIL